MGLFNKSRKYPSDRIRASESGVIPEKPPFTRWVTFGRHFYRQTDEECDVEFVDKNAGIRKTIVDSRGNIVDFPGMEKGEWIKYLNSEQNIRPVIRFRAEFSRYNDIYYIMIWEVQPDGRYWEDSDGFGSSDDVEICLYAMIDHQGCFDGLFRVYSVGSQNYMKD
ncbi:MAG: hypothetical protein NC094_03420 [Bacteroidales bacterium]|nr:hypothetical protein [Lachnoclostridium sp.]MCM1383901.1 hypothetical protein [Lachnoclostridium sp.]MCM1464446.1 hypothetical protein [Bacteroidales bacterium]